MMNFTLIKEGIPYSALERATTEQVVLWFALSTERNEYQAEQEQNRAQQQEARYQAVGR